MENMEFCTLVAFNSSYVTLSQHLLSFHVSYRHVFCDPPVMLGVNL